MSTIIKSFQDFQEAKKDGALEQFIIKSVDDYLGSIEYRQILTNEQYFLGENPTLQSYFTKLVTESGTTEISAKIKVPSGIFSRLVTLQVNRLWYNGVQLDTVEKKDDLGKNFDKYAKDVATNAAVHGVAYGLWNFDHLQAFTAKEYFPLVDDYTGKDRAGVRFWVIDPDNKDKPMNIQLYEVDGWTWYTKDKNGGLAVLRPKQAYQSTFRQSRIFGNENDIFDKMDKPSERFPVISMYANTQKRSELTPPIKAKIDLYDAIMTTFGDEVLRTHAIYWLFNGMTGDVETLLKTKNTIEKLGIIAAQDETTATAQPVSLPYEASMEYLSELEKAIFRDAMITNPQEILGGNLTATAINASYQAEKLKVSDMEWQSSYFVDRMLELIGIESKTVTFKHETVSNDMEITQRLAMYSEIPIQFKIRIDPMFPPEMEAEIMDAIALEQLGANDEPEEELVDGETEGVDGVVSA